MGVPRCGVLVFAIGGEEWYLAQSVCPSGFSAGLFAVALAAAARVLGRRSLVSMV